jgi:hypothetical protein
MKKRNVFLVFVLSFITFGIYYLVWAVKTKNEMNRLGEKIPTAWILIIPIIGSIWWLWLYSKGVEHVTHGKVNGIVAFLLLYLLGAIGAAIMQDAYNSVTVGGMGSPDAALPTPPSFNPAAPQSPQVPTAFTPTPTPTPTPPPTVTPTPPAPDSQSNQIPPAQPQVGQQPGQTFPPKNPPLVGG